MGRVVITHTTYIEGLLPRLRKLALNSLVKTVTPSVINRSKGQSPGLEIRVSREIRGGFKLIARKGSSVQDIYVITNLDKESITKMIS